jgi:voltage-gated potassium channel
MATVNDLAAFPLFDTLSDPELAELANWFQLKSVGEGVTLAREGASGYSFYLVLDGSAIVTTEDDTVATYDTGDFFGEMAILGGGRRSATVTTTSPTKLLVMFGTDFRLLEQSQPELAAKIATIAQQRHQELQLLRQNDETPAG